jgi:alpha-L-fucosidase
VASPDTIRTPGDTAWFVHDRFGMFIHWGLYSMPARHEWVRDQERIGNEAYDRRYFDHFDPALYDPEAWADVASNAGMKYVVITTKHHEGFCLWDSKFTDYKATNTAAGRDLLRPLVEALRKRGLKVGFYHSLFDWHHDHYVIDDRIGPYHPLAPEERARMNATRDQAQYAAFLYNQTRELLTEFGRIDVLWYDFSYPDPERPDDFTTGKGRSAWNAHGLYELVRELQPHVILNDRLDLPDGWDVQTPEQYLPRGWLLHEGKPVVWEACHTFSGSWGYHRDEQTWKSAEQLVQVLIETVSKGGNLLMNVGPTSRGEFDERSLNALTVYGEWMKRHGRSIYGCTQAPAEFRVPQDCG